MVGETKITIEAHIKIDTKEIIIKEITTEVKEDKADIKISKV